MLFKCGICNSMLLIGLSILVSSIVYNTLEFLEIGKEVQLKNNNRCRYFKGIIGGEDMTHINEKLAIVSSDDRLKLWEIPDYGALATSNGSLFLLNKEILDRSNTSLFLEDFVKRVDLIGFPNISFHPQGMFVKETFLYVINHAISEDQERVEVFEMSSTASDGSDYLSASANSSLAFSNFKLTFKYSIKFERFFLSRLVDLIVTNSTFMHEQMYVTTWMPFTDPGNRRDHSFFSKWKYYALSGLGFKWTFVYYCAAYKKGLMTCEPVFTTGSKMIRGIAYDPKSKLVYVSNFYDKAIFSYSINPVLKNVFHQEMIYKLSYYPYSLSFSDYNNSKSLYVGVLGRGNDIIAWVEHEKKSYIPEDFRCAGGVVEIDLLKKTSKTEVMQDESLLGVSNGLKTEKYVIMGSWGDNGILVCDRET